MRKSNRETLQFSAPKGAPQKAVFVALQSVDAAQGAFNAAGQLVNAVALARRASPFFWFYRRSTIHSEARCRNLRKARNLRNTNARSRRKARRSN